MQLHREETYLLPNPTKELIIRAESARRTLVRLAWKSSSARGVVKLTVHHSGCCTVRTICTRGRDPLYYCRQATSRHCFQAMRKILPTHDSQSRGRRSKTLLRLSRILHWSPMRGGPYSQSLFSRIITGEPYAAGPSTTIKACAHGIQRASTPRWRGGLLSGRGVFRMTTDGVVSFSRATNRKAMTWYVAFLQIFV